HRRGAGRGARGAHRHPRPEPRGTVREPRRAARPGQGRRGRRRGGGSPPRRARARVRTEPPLRLVARRARSREARRPRPPRRRLAAMSETGTVVTEGHFEYLAARALREDRFLASLREAAREAGLPSISIAPEQGSFLQILLRSARAKEVLEVG